MVQISYNLCILNKRHGTRLFDRTTCKPGSNFAISKTKFKNEIVLSTGLPEVAVSLE